MAFLPSLWNDLDQEMEKKKIPEQHKELEGEETRKDSWVSAKGCGLRCVERGRSEEHQPLSGPGATAAQKPQMCTGRASVANGEASPWGVLQCDYCHSTHLRLSSDLVLTYLLLISKFLDSYFCMCSQTSVPGT